MHRTLLFISFFVFCQASAQKNFKPGSITDNSGKTSSGYINYREWVQNPLKIEFSSSGNEKDAVSYLPGEIRSFEIDGAERYESWYCSISMGSVNVSKLSTGKDTTSRRDSVFLKVLETGKINLYRYEDDLKERFYYKTAEMESPAELIYFVYNDTEKESVYNEDKGYINQLIGAGKPASTEGKITRLITETKYNEVALRKIVKRLNNAGVAVKEEKKSKGGTFQPYAGAGLHTSSFGFEGYRGTTLPTNEYVFSNSTAPVFFAGSNLYINTLTARLMLRDDISYYSNSHTGKARIVTPEYNDDYTYSLKYSVVSIYLGPAYNFLKQKAIDAYISAGVNFQIGSVSENKEHRDRVSRFDPTLKYSSDIIPPGTDRNWVTFSIRLGLVVAKKIDLGFNYTGQSGKLFKVIGLKENATILQLRAAYYFGKKKA